MSEIEHPNARQEEMAAILQASKRQQTLAGLLVAVLVHVLLAGVLAFMVLPQLSPPEPDLIVSVTIQVVCCDDGLRRNNRCQ